MIILFVENRTSTWLWAEVGLELRRNGHEIHWLVQNRQFSPAFGEVHELPIPNKREGKAVFEGDNYGDIRRTDRGVVYFGLSGSHYAHYDRHIGSVLDRVRPDLIFGECTQFHELLTVREARRLSVPYLVPNATRYPVDRMCFFGYDTYVPIGGEGMDLGDEAASEMLSAITARKIVPTYIENRGQNAMGARARRARELARLMAGWVRGERFITPSPLRRIMLTRDHALQHKIWEGFAVKRIPEHVVKNPWVLYPLQMQPESNIDVYGVPWNDQAELVQRAARALAVIGAYLVIKPNPKSKYELSGRLCGVVASEPNVIALSHNCSMREVFDLAPVVLTVTGTVLLECVFSGKPVACLGGHAMARYPGVTALENPEQLATVVPGFLNGSISGASKLDALSLIKFLYRTSYPAQVWDPGASPDLMNEGQIARLTAAFTDVISSAHEAVSGTAS